VLALRGRLHHGWAKLPAARARLTEPPADSLRRLHYDSITFEPRLLRELVAFAGAERVLLGSDHPFDMADARPAETVAAAGLRREEQAAVLGGNAARLLGLEVHR
jgi:aminocarboxymuconate-semialdehyde decarboxylase